MAISKDINLGVNEAELKKLISKIDELAEDGIKRVKTRGVRAAAKPMVKEARRIAKNFKPEGGHGFNEANRPQDKSPESLVKGIKFKKKRSKKSSPYIVGRVLSSAPHSQLLEYGHAIWTPVRGVFRYLAKPTGKRTVPRPFMSTALETKQGESFNAFADKAKEALAQELAKGGK